jgi:hypothetical protein
MAMTGEERLQIALENTTVAFDEKANRAFYHCSLSKKSGWTLEEVLRPLVHPDGSVAAISSSGGAGPALVDVEVAVATHDIHKKLAEVISSASSKGVTVEECFEHFDDDRTNKVSLAQLAVGLERLKLVDSVFSTEAATELITHHKFGSHCHAAGFVTVTDFALAFIAPPTCGDKAAAGAREAREAREAQEAGGGGKTIATVASATANQALQETETESAVLPSPNSKMPSGPGRRGSVWQASEEEDIKQMLMREEITFAQYKRLLDPKTDYNFVLGKSGKGKETYFKDGIEYEGRVNHFDDEEGGDDATAGTAILTIHTIRTVHSILTIQLYSSYTPCSPYSLYTTDHGRTHGCHIRYRGADDGGEC